MLLDSTVDNRGLLSVNMTQTRLLYRITCSTISNIPYNLIFLQQNLMIPRF
jgi:hypothetical protein